MRLLTRSLVVATVLAGLYFFLSRDAHVDVATHDHDLSAAAHEDGNQAVSPTLGVDESERSSQSVDESEEPSYATEVLTSVYTRDSVFAARASAAADATMVHYPHESFLRWRPLQVNREAILPLGLTAKNSMPSVLSFTLFPDLTLTAELTDYSYFPSQPGAIWRGRLVGTDHGWAEVTVIGSLGPRPGFTMRFFDHPKAYAVHGAVEAPDVYIAIEWSSYREMTFD